MRDATTLVVIALLSVLWSTTGRAEALDELASLHGRVVYLDFWASWCTPCRQSFPWMHIMQDIYGSQGLTVIAVNVDKNRRDAERFLTVFHPNFEVRYDSGDLAEHFKVEGMPTGLVIDRLGVVRFTHIGFRPVDRATYEDQVRRLLSER